MDSGGFRPAERLVERRRRRQQAGEPGDLEEAQCQRVGADEVQMSVLAQNAAPGPEQQAQSGAVEELDGPQVDHELRCLEPCHGVEEGDDLQGRADVDLAVELENGVTPVLVDAQMPRERCRIALHDDIASNRLLTRAWWQGPGVTGGRGDDIQRS